MYTENIDGELVQKMYCRIHQDSEDVMKVLAKNYL